MTDEKGVLAVIGTEGLARLVACALEHPLLTVDTVSTEKRIVASLAEAPALVLVGGRIGRRGPLVLCDAVRLRNAEVQVIVLLGAETDDGELAEHRARRMAGVKYLDLREVPSSVGRGARIRNLALALLRVADDPTSAQAWPRSLRRAEHKEAVPDEVAPTTQESGSTTAPESPKEGEPVPPPIRGPVTEEDREFAQHMVTQSRLVDFRSAPRPVRQTGDAADRTTIKLREQVRDLERRLARLAHVYRGRSREFDTAENRTAQAEESSERLATEIAELRQRFATERETWQRERSEHHDQVAALTERCDRAEGQLLEAHQQTTAALEVSKETEARLGEMFEQAQSAYRALREHSEEALSAHEQQSGQQRERLQKVEEHADRLFEELRQTRSEREAAARDRQELLLRLEEGGAQVDAASIQTRLDEIESLVRSAADAPGSILARLHALELRLEAAPRSTTVEAAETLVERIDGLEALVRSAADAPGAILAHLVELESRVTQDRPTAHPSAGGTGGRRGLWSRARAAGRVFFAGGPESSAGAFVAAGGAVAAVLALGLLIGSMLRDVPMGNGASSLSAPAPTSAVPVPTPAAVSS